MIKIKLWCMTNVLVHDKHLNFRSSGDVNVVSLHLCIIIISDFTGLSRTKHFNALRPQVYSYSSLGSSVSLSPMVWEGPEFDAYRSENAFSFLPISLMDFMTLRSGKLVIMSQIHFIRGNLWKIFHLEPWKI